MPELTIEPIKRILKKAGAKRISEKAAVELANILEYESIKILLEAKRMAEHAGRKTVMKEDIRMAHKMMKK